MPKEEQPHHVILIIALLAMYILFLIGNNILLSYVNLSPTGVYIMMGIISFAIGTAVFKLFHETSSSKKHLYNIYLMTNIIVSGILALNVFIYTIMSNLNKQMTVLTSSGAQSANGVQVISIITGSLPDPYILAVVVLGFFNIFYLAHLFEQKRKKELWLFLIPVVEFIILFIIFSYIANKIVLVL